MSEDSRSGLSDPGDGDGAGDVDGDLRAIKPDAESLDLQHRWAQLQKNLFGAQAADPVKLGRFVILDRLGQGGMGVVYSAYDPSSTDGSRSSWSGPATATRRASACCVKRKRSPVCLIPTWFRFTTSAYSTTVGCSS